MYDDLNLQLSSISKMTAMFKIYITKSKHYIVLLLKGYLNNHLTDPDFNGIQILFRFIVSSFLSPYILKDQQVLRRHQPACRACLPPAQQTSAVYKSLEEVLPLPCQMLYTSRTLILYQSYNLFKKWFQILMFGKSNYLSYSSILSRHYYYQDCD